MTLQVVNRQRDAAISLTWLTRLARRAARHLKIRGQGVLVVAFIDQRTMRALNRRFLQRAGLTDVLSFRYDREPVVGEVLVSPAFARRYTTAHGLAYRDELARYVIHGLLHWVGHHDRTQRQRRRMRELEDQLLLECA